MHSKEWPLIGFTLGMQLSTGLFVLLWIGQTQLVAVGGQQWAERFTDQILGGILLVLVLSGLGAALHLGNPKKAYLAVSNLRSSRLSREVLLGALFGGLVGLFTLLHWLELGSSVIRLVVGGMTSLAGLFLVFGISRVYMLQTVPAWNTPATPVMFYTSAFLLGSLVLGTGLAVTGVSPQLASLLHMVGMLVLAATCIQLATFSLLMTYLNGQERTAGSSGQHFSSAFFHITVWRVIMLNVGCMMFTVYAFQFSSFSGFAILAFVLILLSEVMGRFVFFESYASVGLEFISKH